MRVRRCAGRLRARRREEAVFTFSRGETLLPPAEAQGIERSDAARDNAAGPTLLCGTRKKSATPTQHGRQTMTNMNESCCRIAKKVYLCK